MKNTTKTLSALALGLAIIGSGSAAAFAYQNPKTVSKYIPSFIQDEQDSPEEIAAEKAEAEKLAPFAKISEAEAQAIAQKAYTGNGTLNESQLENEDGKIVYGIEFKETNGNEVDIKVDAKTGEIVKTEDDQNETDEDIDKNNESEEYEAAESVRLAPEAKISESQATETALSAHNGNVKKVVLEDEDGKIVYGVEYSNGDEVKVDAKTGEVVKIEQDSGDYHNSDHLETRREDEDEAEDDQK